MGNYKSRPSTSCSETWKNGISENYAVVRRRLNEDLCHLKDQKVAKRCEESCCSHQRAIISRDPLKFEGFRDACANCDPEGIKSCVNEEIINFRLDSDHFTGMHYAVINNSATKENQLLSIKLLISYGAKCSNLVTRNLFSPLHLAVFKSDPQMVSLIAHLCASDSVLNFAGNESLTSLHLACLHGSEEVVSILLREGAKPDLVDAVKFSPMHVAIYALNDQSKTTAIVKKLAEHGAPFCYLNSAIKSKGKDSFSSKELAFDDFDAEHIPIILLAASRRQVETITFLLDQPGIDVNTIDLEQNTALHVASKQGHVSVVKLLLHKQNVELKTNVYGDTAVHLACYSGKIEIVQILIERFGKECLEDVNIFGETPLHASCTFGTNLELIEFLLCENPRLVNFQSQDAGHTPLHSCSFHGHFEAARLLVQNGADVTILANSRDTTLLSKTNEDSGCGGCEDNSITSSESNSRGDLFTALYHDTCAQWAAENGHDDLANWLNQCRSNGDSSSYRSSGGYTTESSYVPLPSKIGKIKSVTQEKIGVLSLRAQLPKHMQIEYCDIERIEHIGSGGFGKVYKSRLKSKNEIVAVKVYKHHHHNSKTDMDMFVREVKILWQLDNPFIIKFYGVCLDDASNFSLITEFCAHGSLYDFLHKQKRCLDLPGKLVILQNVATGMNYLHTLTEPVIHRDLNSFNILLRESMNAVIADFGESRFIDRLLRQEMLTKQPGNLRWMSPEVFNQCTEYNTKADVFNFSLCVWELLSGELPFSSLTPLQAAQEMAIKGVRPPINDSYPEKLVQLMTRCWTENPNDRPDFATIMKELNDLLLYNHVNTNISNLSLNSPTASFVSRDLSERISVAELRSNFESISPVNQGETSNPASRPNSGKSNGNSSQLSADGIQICSDSNKTLTRSPCGIIDGNGSDTSPLMESGSGDVSQRFLRTSTLTNSIPSDNQNLTIPGAPIFSQTRSRVAQQQQQQTPFMAMSNGYVCDPSQPRLLMAAQRALQENNNNSVFPHNP